MKRDSCVLYRKRWGKSDHVPPISPRIVAFYEKKKSTQVRRCKKSGMDPSSLGLPNGRKIREGIREKAQHPGSSPKSGGKKKKKGRTS